MPFGQLNTKQMFLSFFKVPATDQVALSIVFSGMRRGSDNSKANNLWAEPNAALMVSAFGELSSEGIIKGTYIISNLLKTL